MLALETSCDETSAAVVRRDGERVSLDSLVILSQDVHRIFGGVVPELASRAHLTTVGRVADAALTQAGIGIGSLDGIAVTRGPGLLGALLVGVTWAKTLAWREGLPLIGVHHLEGHLFAATLEQDDVTPPFAALLVSGGHTMLLDVPAWGDYRLLGQTRDDAAGEAFDKVGSLLGLDYPAGAAIEQLALLHPQRPDQLGAAALHEAQIGGVIDDAGKIRVLVIDADGDAVRGAHARVACLASGSGRDL